MKRAILSVALLLLSCTVIPGCGPQEDSTQALGSELRADEDTVFTEDTSGADSVEGAPDDAVSGEEGSVSAFAEDFLPSYESDRWAEDFQTDEPRNLVCPGCDPQKQVLRNGDIVSFRTLGHLPGPRWLDGRTSNGTVGLAPSTGAPYTGTRWRVYRWADGTYSFYCLGYIAGPRWLDGRTGTGTVGLAPRTGYPYTGTRWSAYQLPNGTYSFRCLGHIAGPRWLDGRTATGRVGLAPRTGAPYTGTRWQVISQ